MRCSTDRILTAHAGSLPCPEPALAPGPDGLAAAERVKAQAYLLEAANARHEHEYADCGFCGRSHPQIAWAKLRSLVEGARLASGRP